MPTGLFGKAEKDSESVTHVAEAATRGRRPSTGDGAVDEGVDASGAV